MKKYKIKYQKGNDILIMEIDSPTRVAAQRQFYMQNPFCDIISIEEVTDDETEPQQS